jgi:1-acyl-sn-glycerol-3-phosphate acyltransferase
MPASRTVWNLARLICWIFYRAERIGEPLPDGPALLVANHPNGLLDPALVWTTAGRDIRFLAKSTLFQGKVVSPLIRWSGAIPVYRRIDRDVDLSRNIEMFDAVKAVLALGHAVCLFPEGISHSTGRLEQLRTGAARIALASEAKGTRVAVIPIGLNFDQKTIFRSRVTIAYGRPFFCDDLAGEYLQDPYAAVRALTERIAEHLRGVIVEADPRTDAEIVDRIDQLYRAARSVPDDAAARLERRRTIAGGIERLRAKDPRQYETIREKLRLYGARLSRFGLRDRDLDWTVSRIAVMRFALREGVLAVALIPLALLGTLAFGPPYWITHWIGRSQRNPEARATWKAVAGAVIYAAWAAALVTAAWLLWRGMAATGALFLLVVLAVGALFAIERETAVAETVRAYLAVKRAPTPVRRRLEHQRAEIADVLERAHEWLERDEDAGH